MRLEALRTIVAKNKASALKAFLTGIVCVVMVGFSWLSDPTAADQTGVPSRLLAWSCLAAAAIALIVAIHFTFQALTIREPQKESDLEFDGGDLTEGPYEEVHQEGFARLRDQTLSRTRADRSNQLRLEGKDEHHDSGMA